MPGLMHQFAEALVVTEQGQMFSAADAVLPVEPNPCARELKQSRTPFGVDYDDFSVLDIKEQHRRGRHSRARQLYNDDDLGLSLSGAYRLAHEEPSDSPSGYALAVMMYFLTMDDAIPRFSQAIDKLMRGSLVPGGTILVFGATSEKYEAIYQELDRPCSRCPLDCIGRLR